LVPIIRRAGGTLGTFALMLAHGMSANTILAARRSCSLSASWWTTPSSWSRQSSTRSKTPGPSPADATKLAMTQITGPIIAITRVCCRVRPSAFILASSVALQTIAIAVSISMIISAVNALTLSPALWRHGAQPGAPARPYHPRDAGRITRMQGGYASVVARLASDAC